MIRKKGKETVEALFSVHDSDNKERKRNCGSFIFSRTHYRVSSPSRISIHRKSRYNENLDTTQTEFKPTQNLHSYSFWNEVCVKKYFFHTLKIY